MTETTQQVVPAESLPIDNFDAEGQQLRNQLQSSGDGDVAQETPEAVPTQQDSAQTPEPRASGADTTEKTPDSPETSTSPQRDEKGRFLPKQEAQPEAKEEQPQKQETPYEKAKKEQERQKSVLANFEQEKQRERAAIAAERQQLEQQRQQLQQQAAQNQQPRFNSQDLWKASGEFEAQADGILDQAEREGDFEKIKSARAQIALARNARAEAQKGLYYEQREAYQKQIAEGKAIWDRNTKEIFDSIPEDQRPALAQEMDALITQHPRLSTYPDGVKDAYEAIKVRREHAEVSGLRERAEKAEKQLEELQKRTAITGSGAQPHVEPKSFDQMSFEEQGRYLERNAHALDQERYAA